MQLVRAASRLARMMRIDLAMLIVVAAGMTWAFTATLVPSRRGWRRHEP